MIANLAVAFHFLVGLFFSDLFLVCLVSNNKQAHHLKSNQIQRYRNSFWGGHENFNNYCRNSCITLFVFNLVKKETREEEQKRKVTASINKNLRKINTNLSRRQVIKFVRILIELEEKEE